MEPLTGYSKSRHTNWRLRCSLVLLVLVPVFTVTPGFEALSLDKQAAANRKEEQESVKVIETVVNAWNQSDADTIAKQFLPEAVVVLPSGAAIQSRSEIRKRIVEERGGRLQDTTLEKTVESVAFRDDNTAAVKGRYRLKGMTILNLFEISPKGTFVLEQVREQGRWMIARAELQ